MNTMALYAQLWKDFLYSTEDPDVFCIRMKNPLAISAERAVRRTILFTKK
jgi:hypothetical protein